VQISKNTLTAGLCLAFWGWPYSGLLKNRLPSGLLKNKVPKVALLLTYFCGARKIKSPGLIFNLKPAAVKKKSLDFLRGASCKIGLAVGGENTGRAVTLQVRSEIFSAFIRKLNWPGPMVTLSVDSSVGIYEMVCLLRSVAIARSSVWPDGSIMETVRAFLPSATCNKKRIWSSDWIWAKPIENKFALNAL